MSEDGSRERKCITCGRITDVFYAGHAGQCAVCDVKQQAQQRGIQITSPGDFTRYVTLMSEDLPVKKPPIQLLAETEDTVTLSRATFEGLLDELEDLEDSLALARHRLERRRKSNE